MQDYKDQQADVVRPIDADIPTRSKCDSLAENLRRCVDEMKRKTLNRQKYIEELKENMRANEASIATDRRKAIELKNKCTLQEIQLETQRSTQKTVIDKVNMVYATTKLMKSHCSIQKMVSKDIEDMRPRVEHYVAGVEHLVTDAGRKMALERRQIEQEIAMLKLQINAHTERRDNWKKQHSEMQTEIACIGLESTAAMQVMQSKLDETVASEAHVKQDIERHLKEEKEVEQRLILLRQKVKEVQREHSERKNNMEKDISDLAKGHLETEEEERSLQEELVAEDNVTKQVGEESSRLQERLLTMEDSIAAERAVLADITDTEQLENLKKEHNVVMAKQTGLTEERDSKIKKQQEIEAEVKSKSDELKKSGELLSGRYWQKLDEKNERTRREEGLVGRVDTMQGQVDACAAVLEAIRQRRLEKMTLVQREEEAKSIRESVKEQMSEQVKRKRSELKSLVETTKEWKRNGKSCVSGNTKTRRCNERVAAELAALKSDCREQEQLLQVAKKRVDELHEMEDSLSREVSRVQEHAAKLTQDVNTRVSDLSKIKEISGKEEPELLQSIDKKTARLSALKARSETIRQSDINTNSSVLTVIELANICDNTTEVEAMQRRIEQHKLLSAGKSKYQNELMSTLQTLASDRAKIDQFIQTHGNDIKFLRRKFAKTKSNISVKERNLPVHGAMPPPAAPASRAGVAGETERRFPPRPSNIKPESELDFDFSDC